MRTKSRTRRASSRITPPTATVKTWWILRTSAKTLAISTQTQGKAFLNAFIYRRGSEAQFVFKTSKPSIPFSSLPLQLKKHLSLCTQLAPSMHKFLTLVHSSWYLHCIRTLHKLFVVTWWYVHLLYTVQCTPVNSSF